MCILLNEWLFIRIPAHRQPPIARRNNIYSPLHILLGKYKYIYDMLYIDHRCNTMTLFGSATKHTYSLVGVKLLAPTKTQDVLIQSNKKHKM